jgi:hypothetical protein
MPNIANRPKVAKFDVCVFLPDSEIKTAQFIELGKQTHFGLAGLPESAEKVTLRVDKQESIMRWGGDAWVTVSPLVPTLNSAMQSGLFNVLYTFEGVRRRQRVSQAFNFKGVAIKSSSSMKEEETWNIHARKGDITISEDTGRARIFFPKVEEGCVYEGERKIGRLQHGKRSFAEFRLTDLYGWGEGVIVDSNRYAMAVGSSVANVGCINWVWNGVWDQPHFVHFRNPIRDTNAGSRLLAFYPDEGLRPHFIAPDTITVENAGLTWKFESPRDTLALAIMNRGIRLGAWWDVGKVKSLLSRIDTSADFALIRWLRLPVLAEDFKTPFTSSALKNPLHFLQGWWQSEGLHEDLEYPSIPEAGLNHVVRTVLWNWVPEEKQFNSILQSLWKETHNQKRQYKSALRDLAILCPPSAIHIARFIRDRRVRETVLKNVLLSLLSLEGEPSNHDISNAMERLFDNADCREKEQIKGIVNALSLFLSHGRPTLDSQDIDRLLGFCTTQSGLQYLASRLIRKELSGSH